MKRGLIQICTLLVLLLTAIESGAQPVTQIAAGGGHSLFLKADGSLWAMGYNGYGQLGDGTYNNTNRPERIVASGVTAIAAGYEHSLFLKSDGSLWAMGWNGTGQLGSGTYNNTNRPERIVGSGVTAVAAGYGHSLFIKSDGSLWAVGDERYGQLGSGFAVINTNLAIRVVASNVTAIAAGWYHSIFLKSDGSLWVMGNYYGGAYDIGVPGQMVASNVTAITGGGGAYASPPQGFTMFLKNDGSLWGMGWNESGQLGDGTYKGTNQPEQILASGVTDVAAGSTHSLFLKSDGSLWGMGENKYGELGDGSYNAYLLTNQPQQIIASGVIAIAAGYRFGLFLKSDGSLWGMGLNADGQLGNVTFNYDTIQPEQIIAAPPYNQISGKLLGTGDVQLTFTGFAGTNYALEQATSLSPAKWIPVVTNPANAYGWQVFTNKPDRTTNNFWRIRSVP